MTPGPEAPFNNPRVHVRSWYVVAKGGEVRRGRVVSKDWLGRRVALWRGEDGRAHVVHGQCPHMGADLGRGSVVQDGLRCGFHHWVFDAAGTGRGNVPADACPRLFSYPSEERDGYLWAFNGPAPLFALPAPPDSNGRRWAVSPLPPRRVRCHPHVVACNGFDLRHFQAVHGAALLSRPALEILDEHSARLDARLSLSGDDRFVRGLRWLGLRDLSVRLTTWGGNLAAAHWKGGRLETWLFFANQPAPGNETESVAFLMMPRLDGLPGAGGLTRALLAVTKAVVSRILRDDVRVLHGIQFNGRFTEEDAPLAAFVRQVNAMPIFNSPTEVSTC